MSGFRIPKMRFGSVMAPSSNLPRFRFGVRDSLLTIALICVSLGWFVDHRRLLSTLSDLKPWKERAGALENMLVNEGWEVEYDPSFVHLHKASEKRSASLRSEFFTPTTKSAKATPDS
jgi:hypothetical protein